ncbi:MAG TPA: hypothetical protein VFC84_02245 [Desulfosporosinus sp.]|nr:hypothetical protein [Desulfosporosinus sp.]
MKRTACTICDYEFDSCKAGVIIGNKVFALGLENNTIPVEGEIGEFAA